MTIRLREGDGKDFNTALSALRDEAEQDRQAADAAAAEEQAREAAVAATDAVWAGIDSLDLAAENETARNPDLYQADLDTVRSSLDTVKSSYEVLTQGAAAGYGTVCDDASVVADDVMVLRQDIAAMRADVRSSTDADGLDDDVRSWRRLLANLEAVDPVLLPFGAPTSDDVEAAIRAARRKVRQAGRRGADFASADRLLEQAEAIQAKADAACRRAGG